jgi:hypothetical protein
VTITNLPSEEKKYVTVDKDNKELEYVNGKVERGYYINPETKETVPKVYKRINGKPADKLTRTDIAKNYKEIEVSEVDDWESCSTYFVENVPIDLMDKLRSGKAIKLIYTPGNGYSSYYAFVRINPFNKEVEMLLSTKNKSAAFKMIKDGRTSNDKLKEITLQEGVERASAEEILIL